MMKMTVKEMKELLKKFGDDEIIEITGGESDWGEFLEVKIGNEIVYDE